MTGTITCSPYRYPTFDAEFRKLDIVFSPEIQKPTCKRIIRECTVKEELPPSKYSIVTAKGESPNSYEIYAHVSLEPFILKRLMARGLFILEEI